MGCRLHPGIEAFVALRQAPAPTPEMAPAHGLAGSESASRRPWCRDGPCLRGNGHEGRVMTMLYDDQEWRELMAECRLNATARDCLARQAETAAARPLHTVTQKRHALPPGATRNDYVSIGPYWWPDPERADGLPWIRRDGEVNPQYREYDNERLKSFCSRTALLLLASRVLERPELAAAAGAGLRHWFLMSATRMNPHLEYAQGVPGRSHGRGFGIIEARELIYVFALLEPVAAETRLTAAEWAGLLEWVREFLGWLLSSTLGRDECTTLNNHAVAYDNLVAGLALFSGQPDLAREHLAKCLPLRLEQLAEDGSLPLELARTNSKSYSVFCLQALFQEALQARAFGLEVFRQRNSRGASLELAWQWLRPWLEPEAPWPWPQITPYPIESTAGIYALAHRLNGCEADLELARRRQRWPWERFVPAGLLGALAPDGTAVRDGAG